MECQSFPILYVSKSMDLALEHMPLNTNLLSFSLGANPSKLSGSRQFGIAFRFADPLSFQV